MDQMHLMRIYARLGPRVFCMERKISLVGKYGEMIGLATGSADVGAAWAFGVSRRSMAEASYVAAAEATAPLEACGSESGAPESDNAFGNDRLSVICMYTASISSCESSLSARTFRDDVFLAETTCAKTRKNEVSTCVRSTRFFPLLL